ncbi:MAG: 2-C-methyl-D-erythritol 2,4-cyclodiphosphate synthase [Phycisphaerae bacterium]|nr:2-C-methyl-D-erythritol 2,4-cyclodiphosphate synthase [Phycisphaerae bacterium]
MTRTGLGYDSHRFGRGKDLMLGGVTVEHDQGLAAHSDGDVVLHALTDAILGAIAAGDIGEHFPDTDPKWGGAAGGVFLQHAREAAAAKGYRVGNCDITILAEAPKLSPYKPKMAARIAELLDIPAHGVSIKAKTNEGMGFVGRGEGIACLASVLLVREDE